MSDQARYVGPEHFTEGFLAESGDGEAEAAAVFVEWIEQGFPRELTVMWAGADDSSGRAMMRDSDIVESAVLLLTVPLPMPDDLAARVREYVAGARVPSELAELAERGEERVNWSSAIWDLKHALAWRQEHL